MLNPIEVPPAGAETQPRSSLDWKRFHNPSLPLVVLGPDGSMIHVSETARRLLGYQPAQAVEASFFSLIHSKQLFQVMRDVADMVCHGKPSATWLVRLRTVSGRWQWFKADVRGRGDIPEAAVTIVLKSM